MNKIGLCYENLRMQDIDATVRNTVSCSCFSEENDQVSKINTGMLF